MPQNQRVRRVEDRVLDGSGAQVLPRQEAAPIEDAAIEQLGDAYVKALAQAQAIAEANSGD